MYAVPRFVLSAMSAVYLNCLKRSYIACSLAYQDLESDHKNQKFLEDVLR